MDPQRNHETPDDLRSPETQPSSSSSSSGQTDPRQPQYSGGFTMIPPNEALRRQTLATAQKGEEDLKRWKEVNRVTHVHTEPEKLGGHMTEAEARQKQQITQRSSKLQKKLEQKDLERQRKQEEEKNLKEMKDKQRNKSERLEERERQEDLRRKEELRLDHSRRQESFLQTMEMKTTLNPPAPTHTSSRSESVESKPKKTLTEVQLDEKRVNSGFLDRIQGRGGSGGGGVQEAEPSCLSSSLIGRQSGSTHLESEPEQNWTQETESYLDYDFVLRKLMSDFPLCSRNFLEDIVNQCQGDYDRAHSLLS